jgi:hypothetical protein
VTRAQRKAHAWIVRGLAVILLALLAFAAHRRSVAAETEAETAPLEASP